MCCSRTFLPHKQIAGTTSDRHPNHEASERIDIERKEEIEKLESDDGDFYHGFNSRVLAAVRMFKKEADILHINRHKVREFDDDL